LFVITIVGSALVVIPAPPVITAQFDVVVVPFDAAATLLNVIAAFLIISVSLP